jgi:hypothetical protein
MGLIQVFIFIPIIPEILERMQVAYNIVEGEDEALDNSLNDKVNDAYGLFFASSQLVSPIIGSLVYVQTGNSAPSTCDNAAYFNLWFLIMLILFNGGPLVLSENKRFVKKLEEL